MKELHRGAIGNPNLGGWKMDDALYDAEKELKRVDHLIYVSLKYTRTVDVFKNIIKRLISTIDFIMR